MKQSGIARKLDKLGRIVVPVEVRRSLGWRETSPIEISMFGRYLLLREYEDSKAAPVELGTPIQRELNEALGKLSDQDMLIILELLQRLSAWENNA